MKKTLTMILAFALVFALGVGGTLAWLKDSTGEVKNTFTSSDVDIELVETKPTDKIAKMVPGGTIDKDPTVKVLADSEACWLFVKIDESTDKKFDDYMEYTVNSNWKLVEDTANVYYIEVDAATAATGVEYAVLTNNQVTVKSTVTKAMMDELTTANYPTLTFTAYAIQSANLKSGETSVTTAAQAWALAQ